MWALLYLLYIGFLLTVICVPLVILVSRKFFQKVRDRTKKNGQPFSVAFFHPYCNAGGGGERVLWCAVKAIQKRYPKVKVVVYTGDLNASPDEIVKRVKQRFDITFCRDIEFIYLHKRKWIRDSNYPYFTLLGQSLGSVVLGIEAMVSYLPDIYIDSMGFAFTLPLFSFIGGCTTACYVHYPTISTDMLKRVLIRQLAVNNRLAVARSPALSALKIIYYRIFAWFRNAKNQPDHPSSVTFTSHSTIREVGNYIKFQKEYLRRTALKMYSFCGRFSDTVMVNSSWTEDHINSLWKCSLSTHRLYPPCDTKSLKELPMCKDIGEGGPIKIVSIGQFRPEKDHPLQLKAMYELRQLVSEQIWDQLKLVFIGSCRDNDDFIRVKDMMDLSKHLSLENNVEFKVNIPFEEMKNELGSSMIGLHAMWNEHFGIGIVECMAAGHIMVANRSGGPKEDIVEEAEGSRNGFLASDESEYAEAIATIIKMSPTTRWKIREAARSSVDRFSTEEFEKSFLRTIEPLFLSSSL